MTPIRVPVWNVHISKDSQGPVSRPLQLHMRLKQPRLVQLCPIKDEGLYSLVVL
jgi:hypothetical protein